MTPIDENPSAATTPDALPQDRPTLRLFWRVALAVPFVFALLAVAWVQFGSDAAVAAPPPPALSWTRVATSRYIECWTRDGDRILASGELGTFVVSDSIAARWREDSVVVASDAIPAYQDLPAIPAERILEDTPGIAVASDGSVTLVGGMEESADSTILRTTDDGRTWTRPTELPAGLLKAVRFDAHLGLAVGPAGGLVRSTDDGESWARVTTPTDLDLYALDLANGVALAVGEQGVALRSEDGGKTWTGKTFGRDPLFACALLPDGRGWAVGAAGTILATRDAGRTFVAQGLRSTTGATRVPALTSVVAIAHGDDALVVVGGEGGLVLVGRGDGVWTASRLSGEKGTVTNLLVTGDGVLAATDARNVYRAEVPR